MRCLSRVFPLTILLFFLIGLSRASYNKKPDSTDLYHHDPEDVQYHMGPVLTGNVTVHIIWYGTWESYKKRVIREFINSISYSAQRSPSVSDWWKTVGIYTKRSNNASSMVRLGEEKNDRLKSQGKVLSEHSLQHVIKSAITAKTKPLPIHPNGSVYLLLTAEDIVVKPVCLVCGYHFYTSPLIVGYTLPYAWVGVPRELCPLCAYPFTSEDPNPSFIPLKPPNGDGSIDPMISWIGHVIVELVVNPFHSGWYGGDAKFQVGIADPCTNKFGPGADLNIGLVLTDEDGASYNMYGIRRRFLVQWIWSDVLNDCIG